MGVSLPQPPVTIPLFQFCALHSSDALLGAFQPYSYLQHQQNFQHLHVIISAKVRTRHGQVTTLIMIDSGATHDFMDGDFAKSHSVDTYPLPRPLELMLADGENSRAGTVSHAATVPLAIGPHLEDVPLRITKISYPIILGMPWLRRHDPWIRWSANQITFNSPYCLDHCQIRQPVTISGLNQRPTQTQTKMQPQPQTKTQTLLTPDSNRPEKVPQCRTSGTTQTQTKTPLIPDSNHPEKVPQCRTSGTTQTQMQTQMQTQAQLQRAAPRAPPRVLQLIPRRVISSNNAPSILLPETTPKLRYRHPRRSSQLLTHRSDQQLRRPANVNAPKVSMVNAAAFGLILKQEEAQFYQLSVAEILEPAPEPPDPDLTNVPAEYHEFADVFSKAKAQTLPPHRSYDHRIKLQEGTTPPFDKLKPLSPLELETLQTYVTENLNKHFIRHSQSPGGAPILFVQKADGSLRLCVDYRGLNKITIKNCYPLPLTGEILDRVGKAMYFSAFDMRDGFHLLRMAHGEEWKTAFRCRYGHFEYRVMPFGLCNVPATFQHFTNDVFRDYLDEFVIIYLDDILVFSNSLEEHKRHVRLVLERLREAGLFLKPQKCQFEVQEVSFLGYLISPKGIRMDPKKVEAVTEWPTPESTHDVQMFLGFANFYRRFIKNYSKITMAMTNLLRKDTKFYWNLDADKAFRRLKKAFTTAPILQHFDRAKPAVVEADASSVGLGGVLSQYDDNGILHPCAFHSRKFNPAECNYEIYD